MPAAELSVVLCHLYPDLLNIYGDRGNVMALARRAEWRGIGRVEVRVASVGDDLDLDDVDLLCIGGGEDRGQALVAADLERRGEALRRAVDGGLAVLAVCGGYQLLGTHYQPAHGDRLPGAGVLDAYTVAGESRLIGDAVVEADIEGLAGRDGGPVTVVGFENHSGRTYLGPGARPLGRVSIGGGNNGQDGGEGAVYRSCLGTYLHGSLLPKNPLLADWLLRRALVRRHGAVVLPALDDGVEERAHESSLRRARERVGG